ncbi:helix-turn-helix domain-containing protein [Cohnella nanjingensis]|uniref:Helix-turn-helix transcriptional regulator n=1 Tax=Cohnella nanjingensis TaxID=1387779 RepID=A0A7X0RU06_9BACL|nr:AraC family transcriptional regulator [Cohnella nanjingensis]MBB6673506.1 helix-turn-helix transcriptional regulator [Cohnella nanjingensis]
MLSILRIKEEKDALLPLYLHQPYRLQMGGHFLSDETWSHMDRTITDYELIIGVAGVVFLEADGRMYEVQAGDILLLMPGERHRGYRLSSPGVSFYWFHFLIPDPPTGDPAGRIPRYARCPNPSRAHILARQLLHAANGGYRIPEAGDYFLTCLLIELADQLQESGGRPALPSQLHELLAWIRLHALERQISVERIARHMGYNKDYLSRMFKRRFGSGLLDYIHSLKLEAAKEMLAGGNLGIKEIADRVGFGDDKQFAKWFKRLAGVTPTAYRQAFGHTRLNNT